MEKEGKIDMLESGKGKVREIRESEGHWGGKEGEVRGNKGRRGEQVREKRGRG